MTVGSEPEELGEASASSEMTSKVESLAQKMAEVDGAASQEVGNAVVDGQASEELAAAPASLSSVSALGTIEQGGGDGKRYFLIFLLVVFILGLVGGGIYVYRRTMAQKEAAPESTPTPEFQFKETPAATPTPEEVLDRSVLKIQILNGSGIAGLAGQASEHLESLGYKDIKTGNADSYDYQQTEIAIKKDKENYLSMIIQDLEKKYTLAEETSELDEASDFGVVITLGKE